MWYILTWPFRLLGSLVEVIFRAVGGLINVIFGVVGGVLGFVLNGLTFILMAVLIVAVVRWFMRRVQ